MLFTQPNDDQAPLENVHAHGLVESDMGSDLLFTRAGIDYTRPLQEATVAYDGVFRGCFLFVKDNGKARLVLQSDKAGITDSMRWMTAKELPFAGTIS